MKPLGTITQCFPHVDDETRSILQSVMDEAENYADFTLKLCNKACSEKVPPVLHYFAFFHAWNLDMYPQMDRLFNLDDSPIFIEPLYLSIRVVLGYEVDMNTMYESLVKAMETIPNDWLACHLYLAWRRVAETFYPESDTDIQTMETLGNRINNDKNFECFRPLYIGLTAYNMALKGYISEAAPLYEEGLSLARKCDDLPLFVDGLFSLASAIKFKDPKRARKIMLKQKEIAEELGYTWAIARTLQVLGQIMILNGEYNTALNHLLEYNKATESIGHPDSVSNYGLILVYNLIGREKEALAYLRKIKGKTEGRKRQIALYQLYSAFTLISTGEVTKALKHLDTSKNLVDQSGIQGFLNLHQLLEGILEKE